MNEVDKLRAEIADLREATKLMFAITTHCLAASQTSAQALGNLIANVGTTNQLRDRGQVFDELSTAMLLAVSSVALKQHPHDPEVREIYAGLRPGERH